MVEDQGKKLRDILISKDSFKQAYLVYTCIVGVQYCVRMIVCMYICTYIYVKYYEKGVCKMLCGIGVCVVCVDTGGDGDWSVQACRETEDGFPSWHKDGQVSQVSV